MITEDKYKNDLRYAKIIGFIMGFALGMAFLSLTAYMLNHY